MGMVGKRELIARMMGLSPVRATLERLLAAPSLTCLTYHRIGEIDDLDGGLVSCSFDELEWQARWLRDNVRVLDGVEVAAWLRGELALDGPAACITFDDGYADNLRAGELLARQGLPALFFVTSGFVGTQVASDWDRLAYAVKQTAKSGLEIAAVGVLGPWRVRVGDREACYSAIRRIYRSVPTPQQSRFVAAVEEAAGARVSEVPRQAPIWMPWEAVRKLHALGHTIGAHSHSHPILSTLTIDAQREELRRSKETLERELGAPVTLMAYPVGKPHTFTGATKKVAAECGYDGAFSFYGGNNRQGETDRFDIRRVAVEQDTTRALFRARALLSSVYPL
jgi:peptidoglycan/xylan/chitin deacetylase (PgdA/CDA1 family)